MLNAKLKYSLLLITLMCIGLGAGMGAMKLYRSDASSVQRSLASVPEYQPSKFILGKQAAAVTLEIVGPEEVPSGPDGVTELVGFITQNTEADSWLSYRWTLPAGVELIQGPLSGNFPALSLGQPERVSILVKGFSKQKQKLISLSAEIEKARTTLSASAIIVSRAEDTMESRVMKFRKDRLATIKKNVVRK